MASGVEMAARAAVTSLIRFLPADMAEQVKEGLPRAVALMEEYNERIERIETKLDLILSMLGHKETPHVEAHAPQALFPSQGRTGTEG